MKKILISVLCVIALFVMLYPQALSAAAWDVQPYATANLTITTDSYAEYGMLKQKTSDNTKIFVFASNQTSSTRNLEACAVDHYFGQIPEILEVPPGQTRQGYSISRPGGTGDYRSDYTIGLYGYFSCNGSGYVSFT